MTGLAWLLVVPSPSWPLKLYPQVYRLPSDPMAAECWSPRLTCFQVNPSGAPWGLPTLTGVLLLVVLPSPSWP